MRHRLVPLAALALGVALAAAAPTGAKKAVGSIELTDPAGDVNAISTNDGKVPGFDVVKLSLASDGKQLRIAATLKDPPGSFASSVVDLYIDTDDNAKTGATSMFFPDVTGIEYRAKLSACADYANGGKACSGGLGDKVTLHWGAINLERLMGADDRASKETVVDSMGFGGKKKSPRTPITAKTVEATIEYADLNVRPGQTIRLLVREDCSDIDMSSFFPEVLLTLK